MGAGALPLFPDTRPFLMGFIGTLPFWLTSRSGPTIFLLAVSICSYSPLSKQIAICQVKRECKKLVLLWAQLTKIYPLLPTSVQPISITKTLLIVPTKNERDPPLFTGKLLIKFQNFLRNTIQVIIRHSIKILFSVISSPITLEWQKWKSSKMKGILLSSPVSCW